MLLDRCLSVLSVPSVCNVGCCQTAGRIKTALECDFIINASKLDEQTKNPNKMRSFTKTIAVINAPCVIFSDKE